VWIEFVGGTTEANGVHTVLTVDNGTQFTINVPFVHAFTSNGYLGTQTLAVTSRSYGTIFISDATGHVGGVVTSRPLAGVASFVYSSLLNRWLYIGQGITRATPVEVKTFIANSAGSGLWDNIPILANNDYVTNQVAYYRDNLLGELWNELDNEEWNTFFPVGHLMASYGDALGWGISGGEALYGWYALRLRQIHPAAVAVWTITRTRSSYHGVIGVQVAGTPSNYVTNLFNGTQLNGNTFPLYCAYVGGSWSGGVCTGDPGYNAAPNRPGDVSDTWAPAPYTSGQNIQGPDTGFYLSTTAEQAAFLQNLVNLKAAGNPAAALALMDNDFRQGTTNTQAVTIGGDNQTFTIAGTNYSSGNAVVFTTTSTIFTGITLNRPYYVISPSGSTFKVSLTSGGAAVTGRL